MTREELDLMLAAYVECALWSSTYCKSEDDDPRPMDDNYGPEDLAPETLAEMRADCEAFAADNAADLIGRWSDPELVGHDFWLTRNHHGAGFWDRGEGERGDRLTRAAQVYGEVDLYVGDDGKVYL